MYLKKMAALFALTLSAALFGCHGDGGVNPAIYPPAAPENISVRGGDGTLLVSWSLADDAENYGVYISELENGDYRPVQTVFAPAVTITGLNNGTAYWVRVNAVNLGGSSSFSKAVSGTPDAYASLPKGPAGFTAEPGDGKAILAWLQSENAESYNIYVSEDNGINFSFLYNLTGLSYTAESLINGDSYIFAVTALNGAGESGMAKSSPVIPAAPGYPPAAPENMTLSPGNGKITVSWSPVAGAEGYIVYESVNPGGIFYPAGTTKSTDCMVGGLVNGSPYWFTVTAVNKAGTGEPAAVLEAVPSNHVTVPDIVKGVTLTAGDGTVYLEWRPSAGAESYNVYHAEAENGPFSLLGNTPETSYEASGLKNGVTHWFRITALNNAGESPASVSVFASTRAPVAPKAPVGIYVKSADKAAYVSWAPVFGAALYNVYTASAETGPFVKAASNVSSPYTASGLINGKKYWFTVTAVNNAGESPQSAPAGVTPEVPAKAPAAPSALTASADNGAIMLKWNPVPGTSWYNVYMSQSEKGMYIKIRSASEASETIEGLEVTGPVWFKVSAENAGGESPMSAPAAASLN